MVATAAAPWGVADPRERWLPPELSSSLVAHGMPKASCCEVTWLLCLHSTQLKAPQRLGDRKLGWWGHSAIKETPTLDLEGAVELM